MGFDLEQEMKRALRREDAAPDFSDRVMARLAAGVAKGKRKRAVDRWWRRVSSFFQPPSLKWALAAAAVFLLLFAALGVHRYRENQRAAAEAAEGEKAKEEVMLALKIASAKLNLAQKKILK